MTKEQCIRLVEEQLAKMKTGQALSDVTEAIQPDRENESAIIVAHELSDIKINNTVPEHDDSISNTSKDNTRTFEFKVPEIPISTTIIADRRRSVRIQQNADRRKSMAPKLPSPPPPPPKRRRTTISKKAERQSICGNVIEPSID